MELFNGKYKRIGAALDGERAMTAEESARVDADPALRAYAQGIARQRAGVQAVRETPEIGDAQFRAFFEGIREGIPSAEAAPSGGLRRGWMAGLSLVAAALVVAVSAFVILDGGPQAVQANVVESVSTDIEGARFDVYDSDEGVTMIWLVSAGDDL